MSLNITATTVTPYWSFEDFTEDIEFRGDWADGNREYRRVGRINGSRSVYLVSAVTANAFLSFNSTSPSTSEEGEITWKAAGSDCPTLAKTGADYGLLSLVSERLLRNSDFGGGVYRHIATWECFTDWLEYDADGGA